eukprot:10224242-Alexandrium_andersonii.AAC.1
MGRSRLGARARGRAGTRPSASAARALCAKPCWRFGLPGQGGRPTGARSRCGAVWPREDDHGGPVAGGVEHCDGLEDEVRSEEEPARVRG